MSQYQIDLKTSMKNGVCLRCIRDQDYRVCIEALKENGRALEYVRWDSVALLEEEIKQMCLTAVRRNGDSIEYINWNKLNLKTEDIVEICIEAVRSNCWAFKNIHWVQIVDNLSNEQIYLICLEAITSFGEVLKYMNWDLLKLTDKQIYNLCLGAVEQESWNIAYIDDNLSAHNKNKLYLIAIKQNLDVIIFIDKYTEEILLGLSKMYAIKDKDILRRTIEERAKKAIKNDPSLIIYIKNQTYEICLEAIKMDGFCIELIENRDMFKYNILKEAFRNRKVIAIFIDGRWLFTIGCQNNITKEEFLYRIYNENGGFDLEKGINVHRKIYLDFLEQFL
ncbi:TPA: hypothetical protein KOR49_002360 [Clostridioides difficile]|uniref:hypothetical protein n=2 Tax=Clostridioides difficile TaxID=1496 RepID=UPI00016C679C|nr:hypothetical protein [Clostridioides difficile]EGT3944937.1 hypothetical protein [Clostridioides difficile]MBG0198856.1 hypothetical protein [Clostridioides difficile]MCA0574554.1 hypothetical protein [Clostridioides difficile]MDI3075351.1 hypothetical protein [Clostridioides difficile]MDK3168201.1 hypothetical protein [Clostridioides difficile]